MPRGLDRGTCADRPPGLIDSPPRAVDVPDQELDQDQKMRGTMVAVAAAMEVAAFVLFDRIASNNSVEMIFESGS